MNILSAVKNTAFSAAVTATLNYLEQDPEQNIPKAMGLMDKVLPDGWYEGQRAAFRKAIDEKGNVVIPFNQPDEEEIPPESDAPAGQGQSRGGRSGRKTRPDRIGGIFWAGHDRCPG